MRVVVAVLALMVGAIAPAQAASFSATQCRTGPPKEWFQPKVSHTYSADLGRGLRQPRLVAHVFSALVAAITFIVFVLLVAALSLKF